MSAATKRDKLVMADHRVFFSNDGWKTIWQARGDKNGRSHRKVLDKAEADLIRFLAVSQSSWAGNAK